jgi:hypothetical protein
MDHPQQIEPEQVGVQTGDYVIIDGNPQVNLVCLHGNTSNRACFCFTVWSHTINIRYDRIHGLFNNQSR